MLSSNPMVPGGRPLIDIGYKYNMRKILYFIVKDNAWSTQAGLPYLTKYPDQFNNVSLRPVALPLVMSKFFSTVNEVKSQNKSRQYDLALEKFLVTHCIWMRSFTTVDTGMTITNCWKLLCYGVPVSGAKGLLKKS